MPVVLETVCVPVLKLDLQMIGEDIFPFGEIVIGGYILLKGVPHVNVPAN